MDTEPIRAFDLWSEAAQKGDILGFSVSAGTEFLSKYLKYKPNIALYQR